ncbi:hypothetical protein SAMN06296058_2791 [Pseudoxanthomonas indica]|uniref:Uncharacterized protein n=2 Tax=Pseudoxanthomonas indica TaxID=428993 RepID=A0A1T5LN24_9GAMM|nr:hypothetical protein GCM10007235_06690 [Pseudoxanthomonas indica]SKC77397.1 hypothetical protein SAMN06296058_2791 [Pseudoxanthomonas indica]
MLGLPLALTGCANLQRNVAMHDLANAPGGFVVDGTGPDDYPAFLAGEGLISSCRYAVHHLGREEYQPTKARMFEALLARKLPEAVDHRVTLERFDVYHNGHARVKLVVNNFMAMQYGGWYFPPQQDPANERVRLQANPEIPKREPDYIIGCWDNQEGGYDRRGVAQGHDVIVTWVGFRIDDTPYLFKSDYQFVAKTRADLSLAIERAIRSTMRRIAAEIRPAWSTQPANLQVVAVESAPASPTPTPMSSTPTVTPTAPVTPNPSQPKRATSAPTTEAKPWSGGKWKGW